MAIVEGSGWSISEFKKLKGVPHRKTYVNSETGESFESLVFVALSGKPTFVNFSQKLGELTDKQIKAQKDDLQIVQLETEPGEYEKFSLCKKGEADWGTECAF